MFWTGKSKATQSCFRVPSGSMTIFLFVPKFLRFLNWGLHFDERRVPTTTGHAPFTGGHSTLSLSRCFSLSCSRISSQLMRLKIIHYLVYESQPLDHTINQINPIFTRESYLIKMWFLIYRFSEQTFL
jgi:hypothetical protein